MYEVEHTGNKFRNLYWGGFGKGGHTDKHGHTL
jgi:hypothetical protein